MPAANCPMVASRSALRFFVHQILAIGLQHDRELEVQDLMKRPWRSAAALLGSPATAVAQDVQQPDPDRFIAVNM